VKRTSTLKRSGPIARTTKLAPKSRTAGEFARIYGSKARVRWVKAQPCVSCGTQDGASHNHHTQNGGTGRKADYQTIVPLCPSCHHAHHTGVLRGTREWWAEQARLTEIRWTRFCERQEAA
jgi:hypothetical protein